MKRIFSLLLTVCFLFTLLPTAAFAAGDFSDMPAAGHWSAEALTAAVENGLLQGSGGQLKPAEKLTRAQMAAILVRAFGATEQADLSGFQDVPPTAWYYKDMAKAVQMGIFLGDGSGNLRPDDSITRQEAFTVLARALQLNGGKASQFARFSDGGSVAAWASDALASLIEQGYVNGSAGKLNPNSSISRAEFAQVMHNAIKGYITESGTFTGSQTGNVMVRASGVVLKNITIPGDLFIGEGVANGTVTLENVTIQGRLVIRAGGNTDGITLTGTTSVADILICDASGVALHAEKDVAVGRISVRSDNALIYVENAEVAVSAGVKGITVNGDVIEGGKTVLIKASTDDADAGSGGTWTPGTPSQPETIPTTALSISPAAQSVVVGSGASLTAVRTPSNANDTLTWESSDITVALISSSGRISALTTGEVTISAQSAGGIVASATVFVVMPENDSDVTITEPGTILNGGTFHNLTIAESVGTGNVTLNGVVVTGRLIVCGGGAHSVELNGGSYNSVDVQNTPSEGTRLLSAGGAVIQSLTAASGTTTTIETPPGSSSTIGSVSTSSTMNLVNSNVDSLSSDNGTLNVAGSTVNSVTTTGTSSVNLSNGTIHTFASAGTTEIGGSGTVSSLSATSGSLTTGPDTTLGSVSGPSEPPSGTPFAPPSMVLGGPVGTVSGVVGSLTLQTSTPVISGTTDTLNITGNANPTITGTANNVSVSGSAGGTTGVTILGTVNTVSTTGSGAIGAINVENGSPALNIGSGTTANQLTVAGSAAPVVTGPGSVDTFVTTSTASTTLNTAVNTVLASGTDTVTGTAAANVVSTTPVLESISVTTYPAKLAYKTSDTSLDTSGMIVTGYFSLSGYSGTISRTLTSSEWSQDWTSESKSAGTQIITVTATVNAVTKTATFPISIIGKTVSGIAISSLPGKLSYDIGSGETSLNLSGGEIKVFYSNASLYPAETKPMSDASASGFTATAGVKLITLTYTDPVNSAEHRAVFNVSVRDSVADEKSRATTEIKLYAAVVIRSGTYSAAGQSSVNGAMNAAIANITGAADSAAVTGALTVGKAAIDAVPTQEEEWTSAANSFKSTYSSVLSLTTNTVAITDKANISAAKGAYAVLESGVQNKLVSENTLITALLTKISSLEAEQTLDTAKTSAVGVVNAAYAKYNQSDYTANYAVITSAKNTGLADINAAASVSAVITAQDAALAAMAAVKSDAVLLKEAQVSATTELNAYLPRGITATVYNSTYNATGKTQVTNYKNAGVQAIAVATSIAGVTAQLNTYKGYIDAVKTTAQMEADELAAAKTTAKAALDAYVDVSKYTGPQRTALDAAIAAGKSSIDSAASKDAVSTALAAAKTAVSAVKTDAQIAAEQLARAKADAKTAIAGYKSQADYSASGWLQIQQKVAKWNGMVDSATTVDAITNLENGVTSLALADLNTVMTADQETVRSALELIAAGSYDMTQSIANTEAALKTQLAARINARPGMSATGITITAADVSITGFTAAQAGTLQNNAGSPGSFTFTVSIVKGAASAVTNAKTGIITATLYTPRAAATVASDPVSGVVDYAGSMELTVTTEDILEPAYQWYVNTTNSTAGASPISGAIGNTYAIDTRAPGTRYYYCVVNDSVVSNVIAITVGTKQTSTAPQASITGMAESYSLPYGSGIELSVTPTASTYTYQWQTRSSDTGVWTDITDAKSSSYTIASISLGMSGTQYRCSVTNTEVDKLPATAPTAAVTLTIGKGTQPAPTGLAVISPTEKGGKGSITGLLEGKDYEYSTDNLNWMPVASLATVINELQPGIYFVRYQGTADLLPSQAVSLVITDPTYAEVDTLAELKDAISNTVVELIVISGNIDVGSGTEPETLSFTQTINVSAGSQLTIADGSSLTADVREVPIGGQTVKMEGALNVFGTVINNGSITVNGYVNVESTGVLANNKVIHNNNVITVNSYLYDTCLFGRLENAEDATIVNKEERNGEEITFRAVVDYVAYIDTEEALQIANDDTSSEQNGAPHSFTSIAVAGRPTENFADFENTVTLTQSQTVIKDLKIWRYQDDKTDNVTSMILQVTGNAELTLNNYLGLYGTLNVGSGSKLIVKGGADIGANGVLENNGDINIDSFVNVRFVEMSPADIRRGRFINRGNAAVNGGLEANGGLVANYGRMNVGGSVHVWGAGSTFSNESGADLTNSGDIILEWSAVLSNQSGAVINNAESGKINADFCSSIDNMENAEIHNDGWIYIWSDLFGDNNAEWIHSVFIQNGSLHGYYNEQDHTTDDHIGYGARVDTETGFEAAVRGYTDAYGVTRTFTDIGISATENPDDPETVPNTIRISGNVVLDQNVTIWRYIFGEWTESRPMTLVIPAGASLTANRSLNIFGDLVVEAASDSLPEGKLVMNAYANIAQKGKLDNRGSVNLKDVLDVNGGKIVNSGTFLVNRDDSNHIFGNLNLNEGGNFTNKTGATLTNRNRFYADPGTALINESGAEILNSSAQDCGMHFVSNLNGTDTDKWAYAVFTNHGTIGNTDPSNTDRPEGNVYFEAWTDTQTGILAAEGLHYNCINIAADTTAEEVNNQVLLSGTHVIDADVKIWRYVLDTDPAGAPSTPTVLSIPASSTVTFNGELIIYGTLENDGTVITATGKPTVFGSNGDLINRGVLQLRGYTYLPCFLVENGNFTQGELTNYGTLTIENRLDVVGGILTLGEASNTTVAESGSIRFSHGAVLNGDVNRITNNGRIEAADQFFGGDGSPLNKVLRDLSGITGTGTVERSASVHSESALHYIMGTPEYEWIEIPESIALTSSITNTKHISIDGYGERDVVLLVGGNVTLTNAEHASISMRNSGIIEVTGNGEVINNGFMEIYYGDFRDATGNGLSGNPIQIYTSRVDFLRELYRTMRDGYGFADVSDEEVYGEYNPAGDKVAPGYIDHYPELGSLIQDENPGKRDYDGLYAMCFFLKHGLIRGTAEGSVEPFQYVTRAQAAYILYGIVEKLIEKGVITNLKDYVSGSDVVFEDVPSDAWYRAALAYLAKAGVITGERRDDSKIYFNPDDYIPRTWYGDSGSALSILIDRFFYQVGPIEAELPAGESVFGFTVRSDQYQVIRNRIFKAPVIVDCDDSAPSEDGWGGEILFKDCVFEAGLETRAGYRSFGVGLNGSTFDSGTAVPSDIVTSAKASNGVNLYDSNIHVDLIDVSNGSVINASVPTNVRSDSKAASFLLNGVEFTADADGEGRRYQVSVLWECGANHDEWDDEAYRENDHSGCGSAYRFPRFEMNDFTASAAIAGDADAKLRIQANGNCAGDLEVTLPGSGTGSYNPTTAGHYVIDSRQSDAFTIYVNGDLNGTLEIAGKIDVSGVRPLGNRDQTPIYIQGWEPYNEITIGGNSVYVLGNAQNVPGIYASDGAEIIITDPMQQVSIQNTDAGITGETVCDVYDPHVFDVGDGYQVFVDTANDTDYAFRLWQLTNSGDFVEILFTIDRAYAETKQKLHLVPVVAEGAEYPVTDPGRLRLDVAWTSETRNESGIAGESTICVIYNQLWHKESPASRRDFAAAIYNVFRTGFGLVDEEYTSATDALYAERFSDWDMLGAWGAPGEDRQGKEALAFLVENGILNGSNIGTPEDPELAINPYQTVKREETAVVLYRLVYDKLGTFLPAAPDGQDGFADVSESDLGHWYAEAVLAMARGGAIRGYHDGRFGVGDDILIRQAVQFIRDVADRMLLAVNEPVTFTVTPGEQIIRNRIFNEPVTIVCSDEGPVDPSGNVWGGSIGFESCVFIGGIVAKLNAQPYGVNLNGCPIGAGDVIQILPADPANPPSSYTDRICVELRGVASNTSVLAAVPTRAACFTEGASFTLNGAVITGADAFTGDAGSRWFEAVLFLECFEHDDTYTGDHSECTLDFASLLAGGQVDSIVLSDDISLAGTTLLRFALYEECWGSPELNVDYRNAFDPETDTRPLRINGNSHTTLIVRGESNRDVEIIEHADITGLAADRQIRIGTWYPETMVRIGSKSVKIIGGNEYPVTLTDVDADAVIDKTDNPQYRVFIDGSLFDVGEPHLFGTGNYQVFVDTTSDYEYVLMHNGVEGVPCMPVKVDAEGLELGAPVKTHLVPTTPISDIEGKYTLYITDSTTGITFVYDVPLKTETQYVYILSSTPDELNADSVTTYRYSAIIGGANSTITVDEGNPSLAVGLYSYTVTPDGVYTFTPAGTVLTIDSIDGDVLTSGSSTYRLDASTAVYQIDPVTKEVSHETVDVLAVDDIIALLPREYGEPTAVIIYVTK